jgi:CRISPR-associated protein Csx17
MTLHVHVLEGCSPTPLAHYLKSLAVLRLLGEQADSSARGWFEGDVFRVATTLDRDALLRFFLEAYAPTPLVAPWNGGSGFYPKDNKSGIDALRQSSSPRFARYAEAITVCARLVGDASEAPKDEPKFALQAACRRELGDVAVAWMSSAVVVADSLDDRPRYPALLGTGGNDGRLDFTNNFMQRLCDLFDPTTGEPRAASKGELAGALFGGPHLGLGSSAIGQFHPGAAGGFNATSAGFGADSLVNTWDFVLMLEGALALRVSANRQLDREAQEVQAAAPFAMRSAAAGYGSAAESDPSGRGEQWMPLWDRPSTLAEVRALFGEGRMLLEGSAARGTLDAARAVAALGVARGVGAFERFGYFERNGQANLAVPLGRFVVSPRPEVRLLDEIDDWARELKRHAEPTDAPRSIGVASRQVDAAMLEVTQRSTSVGWQRLLIALGEAESRLCRSRRFAAKQRIRPLPPLSPRWLELAYDGSREFRLAAAIASQGSVPTGSLQVFRELGPIRAHWMPLDPARGFRALAAGSDSLLSDPRVVANGLDLVTDLVAIVGRRLTEAHQVGSDRLPLGGALPASLDDVEAFVMGLVRDARIVDLVRPLAALRWSDDGVRDVALHWRQSADYVRVPLASHAVFRSVYRTADIESARITSVDPAAFALLRAGRLGEAAASALGRLIAQGLRPRVERLVGSVALARRLAAALAIPLSSRDQQRLVAAVCKTIARDEPSAPGETS